MLHANLLVEFTETDGDGHALCQHDVEELSSAETEQNRCIDTTRTVLLNHRCISLVIAS